MGYSLLALMVLIFHTFIVITIFVGALLALIGKLNQMNWLKKIYLASGFFVVLSYVFLGACNLTLLEQSLWKKAGSKFAYEGGCISHYLSFLGLKVSDDVVFWCIVASLVLGFGSSIYYHFFPKKLKTNKEKLDKE